MGLDINIFLEITMDYRKFFEGIIQMKVSWSFSHLRKRSYFHYFRNITYYCLLFPNQDYFFGNYHKVWTL